MLTSVLFCKLYEKNGTAGYITAVVFNFCGGIWVVNILSLNIMLSGNVTLILNDDCVCLNFDFFTVLFTHSVMVDRGVYCMESSSLFLLFH
jgi:hypothetical protein